MAVRRARIKPDNSLPPRGNNYDAGNTKTKTLKETFAKPINSDNKVFESPRSVGTCLRSRVVPPLVKSSRAEVNVQRRPPFTPEQFPKLPKQKSGGKTPAEADVTDGKSKKAKKSRTCTIVSSEAPDDYSAPSMPESNTEDTVMDGIVPPQATSTSKPMEMVKKPIKSENVEVLFDPIVPLPSPSKMRPKLRPVTRHSCLRRNSEPGSASESENESRRSLPGGCGPSTSASRKRDDSHTSLGTKQALPNSPNKKANEEEARKAAEESEGVAEDMSDTESKLFVMLDVISSVVKRMPKRSAKPAASAIAVHKCLCTTNKYRKTRCVAIRRAMNWINAETCRFYRALARFGPNFELLAHLFPGRTGCELKLKFVRELQVNRTLINVLCYGLRRDVMKQMFKFEIERMAEEQEAHKHIAEWKARKERQQQ